MYVRLIGHLRLTVFRQHNQEPIRLRFVMAYRDHLTSPPVSPSMPLTAVSKLTVAELLALLQMLARRLKDYTAVL